MYVHVKRQTSRISLGKTRTWVRKRNLLIATENNAIRTNNFKARIEKSNKIADVGYVLRDPSFDKQMQLVGAERVEDWIPLGVEDDALGIMQEVSI